MSKFDHVRNRLSFAAMLFGAVPAELWANAQPMEGDDEYAASTRARIGDYLGNAIAKGTQAAAVLGAGLAAYEILDWKLVVGASSGIACLRALEALGSLGGASIHNEILKDMGAATWTTAPLPASTEPSASGNSSS